MGKRERPELRRNGDKRQERIKDQKVRRIEIIHQPGQIKWR